MKQTIQTQTKQIKSQGLTSGNWNAINRLLNKANPDQLAVILKDIEGRCGLR